MLARGLATVRCEISQLSISPFDQEDVCLNGFTGSARTLGSRALKPLDEKIILPLSTQYGRAG